MKAELANSGLSEEEILRRTTLLMKAFGRCDPTATMAEYALASKQRNTALRKNNTSPKDFTIVSMMTGRQFYTFFACPQLQLSFFASNF